MTTPIAGRTAVVTGGSSGVGLATARLLVAGGARVLVTGRSRSRLDAVSDELGDAVCTAVVDAAIPAEAGRLADAVRDQLGGLDLLFGNAGVTRYVPFPEMTEEIWDELFAVNAKGPYFTVQRLAPLIRPGGSVVLTTSVSDAKGLPLISAYAAAKAALRSVTRSLATELRPADVRVNAVSPGAVDAGILERSVPADVAVATRAQIEGGNPMRRFAEPDEIARAVLFLAFEATYTNVFELVVDGGSSQL